MIKKHLTILNMLLMLGVVIAFTHCEEDTLQDIIPIPLPDSIIKFNPNLTYGTVTDIDGNVYKTVIIKGKTWMAENLKVTHYRNGDAIPNVTDSASWYKLTTGAYCDYLNTPGISKVYGRLYNEKAIFDSRNLAPAGWHVANIQELEATVDSYDQYGKLKETDTIHWKSPNIGATNETGFTALPSGYRSGNGSFGGIGEFCYYYGSSMGNYRYNLHYNSDRLNGTYGSGVANIAMSVRCVKD
jgi:uncharacterized protein (TIGR02145 family)